MAVSILHLTSFHFGKGLAPTPIQEQKSAEVIENAGRVFALVQKSEGLRSRLALRFVKLLLLAPG